MSIEAPPWAEKRNELLETIVAHNLERRATLDNCANTQINRETKIEELVTRLLEQEDKHKQEIKELQQRHRQEIQELQQQHKEEMQQQRNMATKLQEQLLQMVMHMQVK